MSEIMSHLFLTGRWALPKVCDEWSSIVPGGDQVTELLDDIASLG